MNETPEVSVVIVAYKARDHVLGCLESVRENVSIPIETILVDDGSGDGTPEAVREGFEDVQVVAKKVNEGLCAGRNAALPLVRGRKVLMIDSDTRVMPGALEAMARFLDENSKVGVIGPRLLNPDGSAQPSCRRWPSPLIPFARRGPLAKLRPSLRLHQDHTMLDFDYETERAVVSVIGAAQMWRSDLPSLIGEYDERISSYGGEDVDWCMRSWEAGLEVRFVPTGEIVHEWQAVVRRNPWSRHSLRALADFYYLQWKHRALRRDPRIAAISS